MAKRPTRPTKARSSSKGGCSCCDPTPAERARLEFEIGEPNAKALKMLEAAINDTLIASVILSIDRRDSKNVVMNFTAPQTPEGYALVTTMLKHAAEEMRDSAGTPWTTEH